MRSGVRISPGAQNDHSDNIKLVAVAQLVRASVCGTEGRGFESRQPPQRKRNLTKVRFYYDWLDD